MTSIDYIAMLLALLVGLLAGWMVCAWMAKLLQ